MSSGRLTSMPSVASSAYCSSSAHFGQTILETERLVLKAARIEKPLERQTAAAVPVAQLRLGRIVRFDVALLKGDSLLFQPFSGLCAGRAFGGSIQKAYGLLLIPRDLRFSSTARKAARAHRCRPPPTGRYAAASCPATRPRSRPSDERGRSRRGRRTT